MPLNAAIFIVGAVLLFGFGLMHLLSSSIERRSIFPGLVFIGAGGVALFFGYMRMDDGMVLFDIPLAFIEVMAWMLGR